MAQNPKAAPTAKRLMMGMIGGAGLILLGGGGLIFGLNSQLTGLQTAAQQKENEVGTSEQIAKRYQVTQDNYNDTLSRIQFLEASVSPKSYVPTLLKQLQSLAAATHLTVTAVRPAAPPPASAPAAKPAGAGTSPAPEAKKAAPPPYDTLNIDVDVTGTYSDTTTFLYSLTRFPKILSVVGVQLHPSGAPAGAASTASPIVTTNLKLVAFMFHSDEAATATAPGSLAAAVAPAPESPVGNHSDVSVISVAAGRAERGAVAATRASNERTTAGNSAL